MASKRSTSTPPAAETLSRAIAQLLGTRDLTTLKQQLPRLLAELADTEEARLVVRDGQTSLLEACSKGSASRQLTEDEDVSSLVFKADQAVLWPQESDQRLTPAYPAAMGLAFSVPNEKPMAVSLYRQVPFTPAERDWVQSLLEAAQAVWERLVCDDRVQSQVAVSQAELRQAEFKIGQLKEQLEQSERLKAEFVATMSHELRTPLNVILGFGSLLADGAFGALNKEQVDASEKIVESSERLATLINDLLDWSRLEACTLEFNMTEVAVGSLLQEVANDIRPLADRKDQQLEVSVSADLPPIMADPDRIVQALKHLLDNAVKFTPEGGRVGMRAYLRPEESAIGIDVWDTGIGIPPEAMHRLFERFYQVDSSNTRLYGGTGIGLSLVKELVHRHGGMVNVESQVGQGSTFHVLLPIDGAGPDCESGQAGSSSVILD